MLHTKEAAIAILAMPLIESLGEDVFGIEVGGVVDVVVGGVLEEAMAEVAVVELDGIEVLVEDEEEDEVEDPEVVELPAGKSPLGLAVVLQTNAP